MKINDQVIGRFDNEIRIFAKKFGLTAEIEHTLFNEKTDVRLSNGCAYKRYVLEWDDVPNFTTAINGVVRDASVFFGGSRTNKTNHQQVCFDIQRVLFNDPATIVFWKDGTKTVVKCQDGDVYSEEVGLALCFAKKALGNQSNFNNVFKKWVPEAKEDDDRPVVFTLPELAPCDQMAAQNAIKQLMANRAPSAAEIMAEFKRHMHKQRGATDQV